MQELQELHVYVNVDCSLFNVSGTILHVKRAKFIISETDVFLDWFNRFELLCQFAIMKLWCTSFSTLVVLSILACLTQSSYVSSSKDSISLDEYEFMPNAPLPCEFSLRNLTDNVVAYSTYSLPECKNTKKLLTLGLRHIPTNRTFSSTHFLSLLRNKTLGLIGDSTGLQMFQALMNAVRCLETNPDSANGVATQYRLATGRKAKTNGNHLLASVRKYDSYGSQIIWCSDSQFTSLIDKPSFEFCGRQAVMSDIVVIAAGAWFKPFFHDPKSTDWYRSLEENMVFFNNTIHTFRSTIQGLNPTARVVWRDFPHVGNHDERVYNHSLNGSYYNPKWHFHGWLWGDSVEEASWVPRVNALFRSIADAYGDEMLPWHELSHRLLSKEGVNKHHLDEQNRPQQFHADAVHWCAGGLPHYANLLLEDLMTHPTMSTVSNVISKQQA